MCALQTNKTDPILNAMKGLFERRGDVPANEWQQLASTAETVTVPEKTDVQRAGDQVDHIYFMTRGLVRVYYVSPDGKQHNKVFYKENKFVGSLTILLLEEPARFFIETLEESDFVKLSVATIKDMLDSSDFVRRVMLDSSLKNMARNERREAEFLMYSTEERYNRFARNFPDLIERIPQYHIASYLGITPVALSRYKKQWLTKAED